ncbi:MAG: tetratricopeptide repeat protein [Pseudomonadota bacterium]
MGGKQTRRRKCLYLFPACFGLVFLFHGCTGLVQQYRAERYFRDSSALMAQGNYRACVRKYEQVSERFPGMGDQAFFQMGIVSVHPKNTKRDYEKSLAYFQKLIKEYPESQLKEEAESLVSLLNGVMESEKRVKSQQKQMENLEKQATDAEKQVEGLEKQIAVLEDQIEQIKAVDMSIERKKRKHLTR